MNRILAWTYWMPLTSLVAVEFYVRQFDGWGAWATAPLFLLPVVLSVVVASAGAICGFGEVRAGTPRRATLVLTGIAALPVAWLMVRRFVV